MTSIQIPVDDPKIIRKIERSLKKIKGQQQSSKKGSTTMKKATKTKLKRFAIITVIGQATIVGFIHEYNVAISVYHFVVSWVVQQWNTIQNLFA